MQFAVPQFTEVEDRLIGSLTLKQFLVLLGAGGIIMFFWSILGASPIFFILALPVAIVGIGSALGRYNGRPMFTYLMPLMGFLSSNRLMIFKRELSQATLSTTQVAKPDPNKKVVDPSLLEPAESRLKKLAYTLDQRTAEETEIIRNQPDEVVVPAKPQMSITSALSKLLARKTKPTDSPIQAKLRVVANTLDQKTEVEEAAPKNQRKSPARIRAQADNAKSINLQSALTHSQPAKPSAPKKFDPNSIFQ